MVAMGTSRAAKAPPTRKWNTVIGTLKSPDRTANTVLNTTFSVAMSAIPTIAPVSMPIFIGISEGLRFAIDVKEKGLEEAAKREAIHISETYVIPSISDGLWNLAATRISPQLANSPFGRLAEVAFKKTMNQIMSKGAEVLEEGSE
jgi:small nuclear ribonucleoprotein (snRNP)-like protein